MKKIISAMLTLAMIMSLFTVPAVVRADENSETYVAPASQAITYNMNLDWKFKEGDTSRKQSLQQVLSNTAKSGKKFYEVGYDDSDWEAVSIPHAINGDDSFMSTTSDSGGGAGRQGVFLYRKEFTVPADAAGGKVFFELEGIRQAAYVWVNGQKVGYYEAGIAPMGFDITNFVTPGQVALIAIANDSTAGDGNPDRTMFETVPGQEWGSSYTPDNHKSYVGTGAGFQWNRKAFNEVQSGLVYNAYLHVKGNVYQTLPLYNNLKTTGNYIYADNFAISPSTSKATIHVDAEVRNESSADGSYTLEVAVVDHEGKLAYNFKSEATNVPKATDAGKVYETAVEKDVYTEANIANPIGITKVNTPDVTYIKASYDADDVRFWSDTDPYLYTVYTILKDSTGKVVDVQKKETGFRKVDYDPDKGVLINDQPVWLKGYAQRSTNEWAVIGVAPDWLQDYDMALLKENNANFIRWMHVAPKPAEVRSSDRYGVVVVCPAGDQEKTPEGRQYSQRAEAMRDAMIYFRNNPSVVFWETGNSTVTAAQSKDLDRLRQLVDPKGMRFMGARSTTSSSELDYDNNYAGTMIGAKDDHKNPKAAKAAMQSIGKYGPIMETEYEREESPRRVWDDFSPPDYDYVNKRLTNGASKLDGYDAHDLTQEDIVIHNVAAYNDYYSNRAGAGQSLYSAEAMMVWSDSNMHGRNTASENCRTSGRVDPVRQTKEMFEGTKTAHSDVSDVHIVGHWSYPEYGDDTYNYFDGSSDGTGWVYNKNKKLKRNPMEKTVYVIGSKDVSYVELYRLDGETETPIGVDKTADNRFIYKFEKVDVTKGDAVIAKAYNANDVVIAEDKIVRTGEPASIKLTPHTSVTADGEGDWRADGSDIAYYDVEVVDANGNVCVLNYDRINFTWSGDGEYLGGYNSGMGAGCFQNNSGSEGLSFYFDGVKDGKSTIRQNYVYAENGTNRIFVKSTRKAGTFTLNASMTVNGKLISSAAKSIESTAVETTGGLTTEMQSHLVPGLSSERPTVSSVDPMWPLARVFDVDWSKVVEVEEIDTTEYFAVQLNGTEIISLNDKKARKSGYGSVFGAIGPVMAKLKEIGAVTDYSIATEEFSGQDKLTLSFTAGGHSYKVYEGVNNIYADGSGNGTEVVEFPEAVDGDLYVNFSGVLLSTYIPGIGLELDTTNKVINITYTAQ